MVRVAWSKEAADDLDRIRDSGEEFGLEAAARLTARLARAGESLVDFPERDRRYGSDRRALTTVWPYLILYRVEGDLVRILTIRHGARRPLME